MALQLGALRDALLEAGASTTKATQAAEEVADYDRQLADIRADLSLLKWMMGAVIALLLMVLGKVW